MTFHDFNNGNLKDHLGHLATLDLLVHLDSLGNPDRLENLAPPDSPEKLETKDLQERLETQVLLVTKAQMQNHLRHSLDLQGKRLILVHFN